MIGVIIFTITALILGTILVILDNHLNKKDSKIEEIEKLLPGLNCGSCGKSGCQAMAEAMMTDPLEYKKCRPLRKEKLTNLENYLKDKGLI